MHCTIVRKRNMPAVQMSRALQQVTDSLDVLCKWCTVVLKVSCVVMIGE